MAEKKTVNEKSINEKNMASAEIQKAETPKRAKEAVYSVAELSKAAHRFGTKEECVVAALRYYKKAEATIKETEELVKKFLNKEVK